MVKSLLAHRGAKGGSDGLLHWISTGRQMPGCYLAGACGVTFIIEVAPAAEAAAIEDTGLLC